MPSFISVPLLSVALCSASAVLAATQEELKAEKAELDRLRIRPDQLKKLLIETPVVHRGEAKAAICVPGVYKALGTKLQHVIREVTGVKLRLVSPGEVNALTWTKGQLIVIGNLDTNSVVERLYGNFFVCVDSGYTGVGGYVHRTVHDPFATGVNFVRLGGSEAEGLRNGVDAFVRVVKERGRDGELVLPRLLTLEFHQKGRTKPTPQTA